MTGTKQTDYKVISSELFDTLVDMAFEWDAMQSVLSVLEAETERANPLYPRIRVLERRVVAARELATAAILDRADALDKELAFPWGAS